jgi:ribosomal protein L18E
MVAMQKLNDQIDIIKMRSKKTEVEMNARLKEALEKKKQKDTRGKLYRIHSHILGW